MRTASDWVSATDHISLTALLGSWSLLDSEQLSSLRGCE